MELCSIFVPYVGEASIQFVKALSPLCLRQCDAKLLIPLYRTNKAGQYFSTEINYNFGSALKFRFQIYWFV